jgi:lipoprotein-anchoring transpeptidase ErfK/SrfK
MNRIGPGVCALITTLLVVACSHAPQEIPISPSQATTPSVASTTITSGADRTDTRRPENWAPAPTTTTTTILTVDSLPPGSSLVGHANTQVDVYEARQLATPSQLIDAATILGSPRVFLVESGPTDGWVQVSLPTRPNGSTGWVRAEVLELQVLDLAISVDLSERLLRVERDQQIVLETKVAVGSPRNPTPTGRYFVTDVVELADPSGPWGPFALGLSAHSDSITEFNGGDGIIGIHGTNRPAKIGEPVSLGCVRVPNEVAIQLAELVALGTPVEISE